MKKILFNLALGLFTLPAIGQIVYVEDFNDTDGGWTVSAGVDWQWGLPDGPAINHDGSLCGGNAWATNLTGNYSNSSNSTVTSPAIDCSSLFVDPVVSFELFYKTESCCDEGWMEYSLDAGVTWTKLIDGGSGVGWYNDLGNQWWDGTNSEWKIVSNVIPGAAGLADVRVRFRFSSDGSIVDEGFGFDNVSLSSNIESVTMNGVTNITSGLVLTDSENIEISLTNNGAGPITDLEVCYTVNAGAPVCETIPVVAPGDNTYTFTALEDFSLIGTYSIASYSTALLLDPNNCDDTAYNEVLLYEAIDEYPFTESFEGLNGFTPEGVWETGVPAEGSDFYNTLSCPSDSVVLGTVIGGNYLNNINDYVYSPIFDFSSFVEDPYVLFDLFRNTESCCDEAWLESTMDGGTTWTKVGTAGTGLNWYNDGPNQWWDGTSGGWVYAYHQLTGLAGAAEVQFRFKISTDGSIVYPGVAIDNFTVQADEPYIVDGATVSLNLVSDYVLCGFQTEDFLVAEFTNNGVDTLIGFTVCYDLGAGLVCETLDDTILAGGIFTYSFPAGVDLTGADSHDILLTITSDDDFRDCGEDSYYTLSTDVIALSGIPSVTDISCNGETDGQIFVNPQDGTPGYGVTWAEGDAGFVLGDLAAGYHVYTITDANGCMYTDSAEVIEPDAITLTAAVTDATEPGNGEIDLTVVGGTSPYSFDWDNDGTGDFDAEDITNLDGPATYVVVVTDANGCTETLSVNVGDVSGIENLEGNVLSVFPNPTNGAFQINVGTVEANMTLNIYNVLGEVVYSSLINAPITTIQSGTLAKGAYVVEISNDTQRNIVQLIVQ